MLGLLSNYSCDLYSVRYKYVITSDDHNGKLKITCLSFRYTKFLLYLPVPYKYTINRLIIRIIKIMPITLVTDTVHLKNKKNIIYLKVV